MKKMLIAVMATLTTCLSACASNPQSITFEELPQGAKTFITTYFDAADVSFVLSEKDGLHNDYNVRLKDGTELDFDYKGNLEEIDCQTKAVPAGIVPEKITSYVSARFADAFIVKYAIDRREQKVELNNSLELEFDKDGNFLRIDD